MMDGQITAFERKYPDGQFAQGNSGLLYAMDNRKNALAVHGVTGWTKFTLPQIKALANELPEWVAELEGRNG